MRCLCVGAAGVDVDGEDETKTHLYSEAETDRRCASRALRHLISSIDKERVNQQVAARAWCMACNAMRRVSCE